MIAECGKSRANAMKHGLSARLIVANDSDRLNQLIALFAPDCNNKEVWHAAKAVAEAWLYGERVSRARLQAIAATKESAEVNERGLDAMLDRSGLTKPSRASTDRLARYARRAVNQLEAALERLELLLRADIH